MADQIKKLERKVTLQAVKLQAATDDGKGRWITTEKKQRIFIPDGADMKETVEKAIKKRKGVKEKFTKKLGEKKKQNENRNKRRDEQGIEIEKRRADDAFDRAVKKMGHERAMQRSRVNIKLNPKLSEAQKTKLLTVLEQRYGSRKPKSSPPTKEKSLLQKSFDYERRRGEVSNRADDKIREENRARKLRGEKPLSRIQEKEIRRNSFKNF